MSTDQPDPKKWPGFEVAIEAEGLSPSDIPMRQLAELLEAAATVVEAVARARGVEVADARLVAVRTGSACYDLRIPDPSAASLVTEIEQHISKRGAGAPSEVRRALRRLHDSGRGVGAVRFKRQALVGHGRGKALRLAPLAAPTTAPVTDVVEVLGVIVGIVAKSGRAAIRVKLDGGATEEFLADAEVARNAAGLFLRPVRARVTYKIGADADGPDELEAIEPWQSSGDDDLLQRFAEVRGMLADRGLKIRASEWLATLDDGTE